MEAREGQSQIQYGNGRPDHAPRKTSLLSKRAKFGLEATAVLTTLGSLVGCGPKEGITPSQMPTMGGETPVATLVEPTLAPTEYVLPGVTTETSTAPTQAALETPPSQIEGIMVLPGIEPSAGGPDLIKNPYSTALRDVINAAKFGLVSGENVSVKTGQTCISNVPEKLWHDTLPNNEQVWKETVNGVATYVDQQVLSEVPIPSDTKDATYSCVLGYAVDNPDYKDGTLQQLLVKTNTADGSQEVVATMKAGFSTEDNVEVKNGAVLVNGETQGWTALKGMELPAEAPELKAGIPATMEECNKLELQYKPDGTIDRDWLSTQMKALSKVEHQWLADQGITITDVRSFTNNGLKGVDGLPYSMLPIGVQNPTSCTRINFQGHDYLMYGFAGKHSENSTQIAIVHVIYDDVGNKLDLKMLNQSDYYDTHFSPDITFQNIQTKSGFLVNVLVGGYGQSDNPEDIERWQMAKAINEMNKPVRENNRLIDEQLSLITDQNTVLTPEEEQPWIETVEQSVFAVQAL